MVDILAADKELQDINNQIEWINSQIKNRICPKKVRELSNRLAFEKRRLNNFENKYGISQYL